MKRQHIQLLIGFGISAVFIYYLLPGLKLDEVGNALRTANYWWIVPGVAVYFVGLWARTWRWHYMLRHLKPVSLRSLFPVVCIGYFGNNIYPFRVGEVMRSYVLKRKEDIPMASSLTTVIIERIFDGLVMLLFVFLALPFAPIPAAYRQFVVVLTVLLVLATGIFVWMAGQPARMTRLYGWFAVRLLPNPVRARTDDIFQRFMEGIQSLSNPRDIGMIFLTSVAVWLMETVKYWFVMHAFDFSVSFLALMLMNGIVNLATTLPSAPGYVGTFDTPGIETLVAYGVGRDLAAAYTGVLHVALWVPVTAVGAWFFWREQLTWRDFGAAKEEATEER
jgi:uncharacterized protein (TIRG00374 family)